MRYQQWAAVAILLIGGAARATEPPQRVPKWTGTLGERVAVQRAVEDVYWRHRIWPVENPDSKPTLETVLPTAWSEREAIDGLRKVKVLATRFGRTIERAEVQAEIDRMAKSTQMPDRLREIWAAAGDDADRFGDAIVRPQLADRVLRGYVQARGEAFDDWWRKTAPSIEAGVPPALTGLRLPPIEVGCTVGTWKPMLEAYPSRRAHHVAVWTGVEMFIWGGTTDRSGGLYNPATDSWRPTSTVGAPPDRPSAVGFWTGSEVLIAGGPESGVSTLSRVVRYNPNTNAWTIGSPLPGVNARYLESVVFTGSDVIVWGGRESPSQSLLQTGYRYTLATDVWTGISTVGAPSARASASGVWAGSRMVIWGGVTAGGETNTGGRYDPTTDLWTATTLTGAPSPRSEATSVSTGSKMIVWAGRDCTVDPCAELNDGARYNPTTDVWASMNIHRAPETRWGAPGVWTGSAMVVFGGWSDLSGTGLGPGGGTYTESADRWDPLPTAGAPSDRISHSLVWTGAEAIVWGGHDGNYMLDSGSRFNVAADSWSPVKPSNRPLPRVGHSAVWTGSEMLIWGGTLSIFLTGDGARYDPALDRWTAMAVSNQPPGARTKHTAVWTGTQMIVWGGQSVEDGTSYGDGGRYSAASNSWTSIPPTALLPGRAWHSAVWTGTRMLVWGGTDDISLQIPSSIRGASYNPTNGSWSAITDTGAPEPRFRHGAVWTGDEMIVFGGIGDPSAPDSGARYRPATNSWTPPVPGDYRFAYDAIWTGHEMIAHAGTTAQPETLPGSVLDVTQEFWRRITTTGAPQFLTNERAGEWLCERMYSIGSGTDNNAAYDPSSDRWTPVPKNPLAEGITESRSVVAAGSSLIVWSGTDGEMLCACATVAPAAPHVFLVWGDPADKNRINWLVDPAADRYDVIRGDLATLRSSGGNFTSATGSCLANDITGITLVDASAVPATGFWYLARGALASGIGSYDGGVASQSGSRDAEIAAAPGACP